MAARVQSCLELSHAHWINRGYDSIYSIHYIYCQCLASYDILSCHILYSYYYHIRGSIIQQNDSEATFNMSVHDSLFPYDSG